MQSNGAVVAPHRLITDLTVTQAWQEGGGQQEIIQPPAHVLGAGVHHVGPERVGVGLLRVELAEAVSKTSSQQLAEAFPLLWGEACVLLVALGVLQVNLLVGYVEVTAQH